MVAGAASAADLELPAPLGSAWGVQNLPVAAFADGTWLVAWHDQGELGGKQHLLHATRVGADGQRLDSRDLILAAEGQQQVALAGCGKAGWIAVWTQGFQPKRGPGTSQILAQRISADGSFVDRVPLPLSSGQAARPVVACDGERALVAWTEQPRPETVTAAGAIVPMQGAPGSPRILAAEDGQQVTVTGVAVDGVQWLVTWSQAGYPERTVGVLRGRRFSLAELKPIDPRPFALTGEATQATTPRRPAVGGPKGFAFGWTDISDFHAMRAHVTTISAAGVVAIADVGKPGTGLLGVAPAAGGWWVAFDRDSTLDEPQRPSPVQVARLTAGTLGPAQVAPGPLTFDALNADTALESDGGNRVLLVWVDSLNARLPFRSGMPDVHATPLSGGEGGTSLAPGLVSIGRSHQQGVAVAGNDTGWLLAWVEHRTRDGQVVSARLSPRGQPLDERPMELSLPAPLLRAVVVASSASLFLVSWADDSNGLQAVRVEAATGKLLDAAPIKLGADGHANPSVAFDGKNFLVVWETQGRIVGARVSPEGKLLQERPFPVANDLQCRSPAAACVGKRCVVVYPFGAGQLNVARGVDGVFGQSSGIPAGGVDEVSVAPRPDGFLVAWSGAAEGPEGERVLATIGAAHLDPDKGTVREVSVPPGQRDDVAPSVAGDAVAFTRGGSEWRFGVARTVRLAPLGTSRLGPTELGPGERAVLAATARGGLLAAWEHDGKIRVRLVWPAGR